MYLRSDLVHGVPHEVHITLADVLPGAGHVGYREDRPDETEKKKEIANIKNH